MLPSKMAHLMSIIAGIGGAGALVGAWIRWRRREGGTFLGRFQADLFNDANVLELITIAMAVCTLVRLQLEKARPGSSPLV